MAHVFRTEAKAIKAAITSIKGRGLKLDQDIQAAGLDVLKHAATTGDTTLADALVHAMPQGGRKLALVEWMLAYGTFGKISVQTKEGKLAADAGRLFQHDKARAGDLVKAELTPWVEFKKEAHVLTAFDAHSAMRAFTKRMQDAAAKGLTVEGKAEAAALMRAALASLEA